MANSATAAQLVTTLDDDAWDDLLSFIEERRVIPIVGPELLLVATDRGPRLLFDWVAEKLAARLNVDTAELPQPYTLNDVVCWFLAARGRREEAYVRLRSIIKDAAFEPPAALRRLAAITDFDLFVSTTSDSLLESAINLERFGGSPSTEVLSYAPNRVVDLPAERDRLQRPVVYHLFGKLSASPTYVISDEDLLEFICALQSEHLAPEKLLPRARAQSPAVHRQQLHQLAGAAVPAHGETPAPVRSARRRRGAGGRPHAARTTAWWPSCSR